jgi:peptide-methionine (R)-S-oxide reductase
MSEEPFPTTEAAWRARLTPLEYRVLRQGATEQPFTGEYELTTTPGVYCCRACGAQLFTSTTKFASHCGWPSFFRAAAQDRVTYHEDRSIPGAPRTEVRCARCGCHLGHVFAGEGYGTPTDLRFCINSVCLTLRPDEQ